MSIAASFNDKQQRDRPSNHLAETSSTGKAKLGNSHICLALLSTSTLPLLTSCHCLMTPCEHRDVSSLLYGWTGEGFRCGCGILHLGTAESPHRGDTGSYSARYSGVICEMHPALPRTFVPAHSLPLPFVSLPCSSRRLHTGHLSSAGRRHRHNEPRRGFRCRQCPSKDDKQDGGHQHDEQQKDLRLQLAPAIFPRDP